MKIPCGNNIIEAISALCQRDIVVIPAETNYLYACNALDAEAVGRIREINADYQVQPLELLVPYFEHVSRYVKEVPVFLTQLAERFSPGPISYLLPRNHMISDMVSGGLDRIAVRVPAHPLALSLLQKLHFPLGVIPVPKYAGMSVTASRVSDGLPGNPSYVLDGGATAVGPGPSLVGYQSGKMILYRKGAVTADTIGKVTGLPVVQHIVPMLEKTTRKKAR